MGVGSECCATPREWVRKSLGIMSLRCSFSVTACAGPQSVGRIDSISAGILGVHCKAAWAT